MHHEHLDDNAMLRTKLPTFRNYFCIARSFLNAESLLWQLEMHHEGSGFDCSNAKYITKISMGSLVPMHSIRAWTASTFYIVCVLGGLATIPNAQQWAMDGADAGRVFNWFLVAVECGYAFQFASMGISSQTTFAAFTQRAWKQQSHKHWTLCASLLAW